MAKLKGKKKGKKSGFVYKPLSAERVKKQATATGSRFDGILKDGIDIYKFKVGDNMFRILPPTWDGAEGWVGLEIYVHSFIGANNGNYLCLAKMKNQRCPICEASKDAQASGDKEEAGELSAKQRYIYWVLDRDDEASGPKVLELSWSQDQSIAAICQSKKGNIVSLDHPDSGHDVIIQKRGQGLQTKYYGHRFEPEACPILEDEDEQDELLNFISENPLTDLLVYKDADYLESVISGTASPDDDDEDEDDEDEDDRSAKKKKDKGKSSKSDKKKRRDEDEDDEDEDEDEPFDADDDEEDEDEDDEDEDEDERPAKKKSSSKKSSKQSRYEDDEDEDDEDEDDEDDEDEDDEDEDERPAKKKSSSKKESKPAKKSARAKRFGR